MGWGYKRTIINRNRRRITYGHSLALVVLDASSSPSLSNAAHSVHVHDDASWRPTTIVAVGRFLNRPTGIPLSVYRLHLVRVSTSTTSRRRQFVRCDAATSSRRRQTLRPHCDGLRPWPSTATGSLPISRRQPPIHHDVRSSFPRWPTWIRLRRPRARLCGIYDWQLLLA